MKKKLSQKKQGVLLKKKRNTTSKVHGKEKIIITAALPYANGSIHIGHLLEYIQADIYARFLKLQGKDALYICASDMHGTPIEVNAQKAGKKPEEFVEFYWKEHQADFVSFLIQFDNYYKTHSAENRELSLFFFSELKKKGYIYRKSILVIYCPVCRRSLPDRYVKGTCPQCHAADQYGDVCEQCSSVLKGVDLIDPYCVICKNKPIQKESEHYFFTLGKFASQLKKWIRSPDSGIQEEVRNWLNEWLTKGLDDWCISRDGPYFGFEIPDAEQETGEKKYFYVWLDAPIGYISSTKNYCDKKGLDWKDYWYKGKVSHFIGKDIAYFHYLFWVAMLMGVGIPVPRITMHGFVTVNGERMSKSRGTFFTAKDFLKLYPAEALRFYYASHLDRKVVDINLNLMEFQAVNNNVFMGSLGNFCYRVLTFAQKNYGGVKEIASEKNLQQEILVLVKQVEKSYATLDYKSAVKSILQIADMGNAYFQHAEPWKNKDVAFTKVGFCVQITRILGILTAPIVPEFSRRLSVVFGGSLLWRDMGFTWKGKLGMIEMLVQKIEKIEEFKPVVSVANVSYTVSSDVTALGVKVRFAQLHDLHIKKKHESIERWKSELRKNVSQYENRAVLDAYNTLNTKMGVDSAKYPNSVVNLISLIKEKGKLPQINTVVDIYNIISVQRGISMATHDVQKINGKIQVRLSHEGEIFLSLDGFSEKLQPGEVIYADDTRVLGRFSKQCKQTVTTVDSRDVVLVAFGNALISDAQMDAAVKKTCELVVQCNGGSYTLLSLKEKFPLRLALGKVISVKNHPNADSLYVLQADFGGLGRKQVVAGLKKFLSPAQLEGTVAVFCVNMKPAKLRGEMSEAMILVTEEGDRLELLTVAGGKVGDAVTCEGCISGAGEVTYDDFKKLGLEVLKENVVYKGRKLVSAAGAVVVQGMKDGTKIL